MIYHLVLRPDLDTFYCWHEHYLNGNPNRERVNAFGCTKILYLNRQTYSGAISLLEKMPNNIYLKGTGNKIFRHPLANGKPNFFHSHARTSATFVPDGLSELEFISLRNVTLWVGQETPSQDFVVVTRAIRKCRTLREIVLKCQVCSAQKTTRPPRVFNNFEWVKQMKKEIKSLIFTCINKGIKLSAEENTAFQNLGPPPRRNMVRFRVESYQDPLVSFINGFAPLRRSNQAIDRARKAATERSEPEPLREFQLTPECRCCYAVFESDIELRTHLARFPRHKMPFVQKQYNAIHPLAESGGGRHACLVCGRSFNGERTLNMHIESTGHHRNRKEQGVVPRFVKDNKWFKCTGPCWADEAD